MDFGVESNYEEFDIIDNEKEIKEVVRNEQSNKSNHSENQRLSTNPNRDVANRKEHEATDPERGKQAINRKEVKSRRGNEEGIGVKQNSKHEKQAGQDKKQYVLYILTDNSSKELIEYFGNRGVTVAKEFYEIEDLRNELLMQVKPAKIVIIDSGTGKFTGVGARKKLIDLLGISSDTNRIVMFNTNKAIKSAVKGTPSLDEKNISWFDYKGTAYILLKLLEDMQVEQYLSTGKRVIKREIDREQELKYKGVRVRKDYKFETVHSNDIDSILFLREMRKEDNLNLEEYNVTI